MKYVMGLEEISLRDLPLVGGKNASLGEMVRSLATAGVRVPKGFAITVEAFRSHLEQSALVPALYRELDALDESDVRALSEVAGGIRKRIANAQLPEEVTAKVRAAYARLSREYDEEFTDVAVRSSATAEDLPSASFAGQQETYLNVRGWDELDRAIRLCMASLFTDRAIVYRAKQGIAHWDVALSVCVQKMVRSDLACAGVMFTLDTESGFSEIVLINGAYGLGETVVKGRVNPDEFWVHKPTLRAGFKPILRKERGEKAIRAAYSEDGRSSVAEHRVPLEERERFALSDDEVLDLARTGLVIEDHYSSRAGQWRPMDIEWAKDGRDGLLYVVQARPETVHAAGGPRAIEVFKLTGKGDVLVSGKSVGNRVGAGPVRIVTTTHDLEDFVEGEVLVAEMTDPDWEPVLERAAAVVTDRGGRTCHAAIVSREQGLPCVVGTRDASRVLQNGEVVTVSCAEGDEGRVYRGRVPFECKEIDPARLPESPVPLMLNLANPDLAFHLAQLPSAGVGLMRIEFLVSNWVGVHPMALVHPGRVPDPAERAAVMELSRGHANPAEFFITRLASGVAQIAGAFYPRPVIVRFSDFKTNEYARLLGGSSFEPEEANPMIGFRGASRYYDERYRAGFALECRALRRVRETMGLSNVEVMIPFCRTLAEGRAVLDEMAQSGLERGKHDLKVWVMCEIPNNVVLAEEFSELFDGFSIGSNDLTQLTLGVDRDSEILAHVFDERDPGVKRMIEMVVAAAHEQGRRVGICGQAPSDYPDFAAFLADLGIDSISLNPDSIAAVATHLAARRGPAFAS